MFQHKNLSLKSLSDNDLTSSFRDLIISEREQLILQLEHIQELDRRKLFYGYSSLWAFLVEEFNMEESHAERKIRAARKMTQFPEIKEMLGSGKLNLSLLSLAQGVATRESLQEDKFLELIRAVAGKSCKAAKREIATLYPQYLDLPHDRINPINAEYSEVTFVAHQDLLDRLHELQGLLAHANPQIKMRDLIENMADDFYDRYHPEAKANRAEQSKIKSLLKKQSKDIETGKRNDNSPLAEKVPEAESKGNKSPLSVKVIACVDPLLSAKAAASANEGKDRSEVVPSAIKEQVVEIEDGESPFSVKVIGNIQLEKRKFSQEVVHALVKRDGYSCSWIDELTGNKCDSTWGLEKDHIQSYSSGGNTDLINCRWLCKSHHRRVSYLEFGESSKYFKLI